MRILPSRFFLMFLPLLTACGGPITEPASPSSSESTAVSEAAVSRPVQKRLWTCTFDLSSNSNGRWGAYTEGEASAKALNSCLGQHDDCEVTQCFSFGQAASGLDPRYVWWTCYYDWTDYGVQRQAWAFTEHEARAMVVPFNGANAHCTAS